MTIYVGEFKPFFFSHYAVMEGIFLKCSANIEGNTYIIFSEITQCAHVFVLPISNRVHLN